jgi:hypothetical protein
MTVDTDPNVYILSEAVNTEPEGRKRGETEDLSDGGGEFELCLFYSSMSRVEEKKRNMKKGTRVLLESLLYHPSFADGVQPARWHHCERSAHRVGQGKYIEL